MIDTENLNYPKKSIRNDIDKWYKSSELKDTPYMYRRVYVLTRLDRYVCTDTADDGGTSTVSLISSLPWFDETKYLDYAKDLLYKMTYTSQFESIFNAMLVHFLLKKDYKRASEFIEYILDNCVDESTTFRKFDIIVPQLSTVRSPLDLSGLDPTVMVAVILLKYTNKHDEKMKDSVRRSLLNILSEYRDNYNENVFDYNIGIIKDINSLLKPYRKYAARREQSQILHTTQNVFTSPEIMLQAMESNEMATMRVIDDIDEFWNDREKKTFISCYNMDHDRLINILVAFFNKCGNNTAKAKERAHLLYRLCEELKTDNIDIGGDIAPYLNEVMQTEYLYMTL